MTTLHNELSHTREEEEEKNDTKVTNGPHVGRSGSAIAIESPIPISTQISEHS